MIKRKYVFFQRWRLFFFGMSNAWKSGLSNNEAEKAACAQLAELSVECLRALREGRGDAMLEKLTALSVQTKGKDPLAAMLDGTHKDVPEWLRK